MPPHAGWLESVVLCAPCQPLHQVCYQPSYQVNGVCAAQLFKSKLLQQTSRNILATWLTEGCVCRLIEEILAWSNAGCCRQQYACSTPQRLLVGVKDYESDSKPTPCSNACAQSCLVVGANHFQCHDAVECDQLGHLNGYLHLIAMPADQLALMNGVRVSAKGQLT